MLHKAKSIRCFIGARNFALSRQFYTALGFKETVIANNMSLFSTEEVGFYLQDAYVKDWIDNSMIFLEVADVKTHWKQIQYLDLLKYKGVRISNIQENNWGREYFVHDPSGVLWHFGEFHNQ